MLRQIVGAKRLVKLTDMPFARVGAKRLVKLADKPFAIASGELRLLSLADFLPTISSFESAPIAQRIELQTPKL